MPIYSFCDKETEEEFELTMTYEEMIQFLENNPQLYQTFRMNVVDPVGIGITKPPSDFQKFVLGRVKDSVPQTDAVASKRWTIPKEI